MHQCLGLFRYPFDPSLHICFVIFSVLFRRLYPKITVTDATGNELVSITAERDYGHMFISSASIRTGGTYTVNINGSAAASITVGSSITNYN